MTSRRRILSLLGATASAAVISTVLPASAEAVTYYRSPLYSGYKSCDIARTSATYNNSYVRAATRCQAYEHPQTRAFTGYRFLYASR